MFEFGREHGGEIANGRGAGDGGGLVATSARGGELAACGNHKVRVVGEGYVEIMDGVVERVAVGTVWICCPIAVFKDTRNGIEVGEVYCVVCPAEAVLDVGEGDDVVDIYFGGLVWGKGGIKGDGKHGFVCASYCMRAARDVADCDVAVTFAIGVGVGNIG